MSVRFLKRAEIETFANRIPAISNVHCRDCGRLLVRGDVAEYKSYRPSNGKPQYEIRAYYHCPKFFHWLHDRDMVTFVKDG